LTRTLYLGSKINDRRYSQALFGTIVDGTRNNNIRSGSLRVEQVTGQTPVMVSKQYRTSLDFTHIYESDQALLVKRITAQQLEDIVAARSTIN
jgi:hypothetical protein